MSIIRIIIFALIFVIPYVSFAQEVQRSYKIYVPNNMPKKRKVPLVVVMHGGLGNADFIRSLLVMDNLADQYKFVVLYPNGTEEVAGGDQRTWNAGPCCGIATEQNVDDVGFLESLIKHVISDNNVDANKVFMLGHSNGAMMGYRFACERPGIVKSFVSVSGTFLGASCVQNDGLKVLQLHGKNDTFINPDGGTSDKGLTYRSVVQNGEIITNAGGSFDSLILDGAGHPLSEIQAAIFTKFGTSLSAMSLNFMNGKRWH